MPAHPAKPLHLRLATCVWTLAVLPLLATPTAADVIVLANRTNRPLAVRFIENSGKAVSINMPPGDVVPVFSDGKPHIEFDSGGGRKSYELDANCAYFFGNRNGGGVDLQRIGLGEDGTALGGRSLPGSAAGPAAVIRVKICVDEEEPGRREQWERRLRRRVEAASAILEKFCGVKLQVVATEVWNSDNATNDLHVSLGEFEKEVNADPADVAIGFSGQYQMVRGRTHMAGTRGPLHSHILAREGAPQISEAEKLEYLVHELGHFLGAAHSPEPTSVMRPVLGDNRAGRSDFRIQFDPVNALAVAMVGEEIRRREIDDIAQLTPLTKQRLRQIYSQLARSLPEDPAAMHYVRLMGAPGGTPLVQSARQVLQEVVLAATANRALPEPPARGVGDQSRRSGDELTNYYVRQAAHAASQLPEDVAPQAFLLALAVGLDDAPTLASIAGLADSATGVEPPSERTRRLAVLGEPTLGGRRDLARHFFISAYIAAALGADAAHAAGLAKETLDAQGASGFSFVDLAADRAGVRFAQDVTKRTFPLAVLAKSFDADSFMPVVDGLADGLSTAQFQARYGAKTGPAFLEQLREIDRRILALPPYKPSTLRLAP